MAAPLPESDADLVALALDGRQEAFSALYERYFPSVYDFLSRLLRDRDEAADVAQDTFIKAMEQLDTLEDSSKFKSWLFTIAHRRGLNRIRSSKRTAPGAVSAVDDDERATMAIADSDPAIDPERMAELQEAADMVWEAAAGLDPRTYTVMDLHVRHGLDSAEIADVMGVSKGNAYTMVSRMKDAFSASLGTYLVVRNASDECRELAGIVGDRGEDLTPQLRRKVDRHIRRCDTCSANRVRLDPVTVFATLMLVPVPIGLQAGIWGGVAAGATAAAGAAAGATAAGAGGSVAGAQTSGTAAAGAPTSGTAAAGAGVSATSGIVMGVAAAGVVAALVAAVAFSGGGGDGPLPTEPPPAVAAGEDGGLPLASVPPTVPEATALQATEPQANVAVAEPEAPPSTVAPPTTVPPDTTTSTTQPPTTTTTTAAPDDPVVPGPGRVKLDEDGSYHFDPLEGAYDPLGRDLVVSAYDATTAAGGTVVEGSLIYTPPPDYNGSDSFTYTVSAGSAEVVIRVQVDVTSVPDPPRPPPGDLAITAREDTPVTVDGLEGWEDPDGGALRLVAERAETRRGGTARIRRDGTIVYTPPPDFSGSDRFSYRVTNDSKTVAATAAVTVVPAPDDPRVSDLTATAPENTPIGAHLGTLRIVEPDGDDYTVKVGSGVIAVDTAGKVTLKARLDHETAPLLVVPVTVTDSTGRSATATITVHVTDVNEAPTVSPAAFSVPVRTPQGAGVGRVTATDPDDGDSLGFSLSGGGGMFAIDGNGRVKVAGDLSAGQVAVTVTATDRGGLTGSATVTVSVLPEPPPTISDVAVDPDTIHRNVGDRVCPAGARTTVLTATVGGTAISATVHWRVVVGNRERSGTVAPEMSGDRLVASFTLVGNTGGQPDEKGTLLFTIVVTGADGAQASATAPTVRVLPCPPSNQR